jgi:hypothetical protein
MPDLQTNNQFSPLGNDSIVYGHEFLVDDSPSEQPNFGAWNIGHIQSKKFLNRLRYTLTPAANQGSVDILIYWEERKDPFTQADLLDNEEGQVQELIFLIRMSLSIAYRESLANKLVTLFSDAKEEDHASIGIAADSLRSFYNFLRLHTNLKCPTISLTPEYNIYASWRAERNRVFSVHFLPSNDVRFVIFKPNDRHRERKIRLSGTATPDMLIETAAPYGVLDWIAE